MIPGRGQFQAELMAAVVAVVPPALQQRAMDEAWHASSGGRHVIGNNWWQLQGKGDAGWYDEVTFVDGAQGGRSALNVVRRAKFTSAEEAARAWGNR